MRAAIVQTRDGEAIDTAMMDVRTTDNLDGSSTFHTEFPKPITVLKDDVITLTLTYYQRKES